VGDIAEETRQTTKTRYSDQDDAQNIRLDNIERLVGGIIDAAKDGHLLRMPSTQ
jgi:hypothetical protein